MMRLNRKKLSVAVARALAAGAVAGIVAPQALAQQPASPPVEKMERVEVTGSRIQRITLESDSPVNVITAQDIKFDGVTNTVNIVNQLPSVYADQDSSQANGATGTATINLRGIGPDRTLVLLNGRRMPAGDPNYFPTDINFIPAPLIQRVEVLTGGASAVYGSDAVAGVVNFIMNDKFEGVQVDYTLNGYNHQQGSFVSNIVAQRAQTNPAQFSVPGDLDFEGQINDVSVLMGSNFAGGKGNATVFFGYHRQQALLQAQYDYSACAIASSADPDNPYSCSGSSTAYPGRFINAETGTSWTIANAAGNVRPFSAATDQFNFAPYNFYQRPDERWSAAAFAHYDVNPMVRVYGEFGFMDDYTSAQIAPSGVFLGAYQLSGENPLLSTDFRNRLGIGAGPTDILIGRRNVEGGGRIDNIEHTDYRMVLGAKGSVLDNKLDYNLWYQYGKNVFNSNYQNDFSNARIARALDVVTNPANGQPVCRSVLDGTDPNCVPYNIFQLGGVTPAALAYLQTPGFQSGHTSQEVIGLTLNSDLGEAYGWRTPWAKNGLALAGGIEYRKDYLDLKTDTAFSTNDLAGQGGATIGLNGQTKVMEPFVEMRLPIVEDMQWARSINLSASYRYSDYENSAGNSFTTDTWGVGLDWAPVKEAKLRGTYQVAVRAPNIIDLFTAQGTNLFDMDADPCGPSQTATLAQCLRTGLPANLYGAAILDNPAGQYNYLQGGNAALNPEEADTWTLGLVLQPLPNLSATIDYWHIEVDKLIDNVEPALQLQQCLDTGVFCNNIQRDRFGTLWLSGAGGQVVALNENLGSLKTSGIDLAVNWTQPFAPGWGSLNVGFVGTWVEKFETQPLPNGGSYDCVGMYGATCGQPLPEWRHRLRFTWNAPYNLTAALTWRYMSSVTIDAADSNALLAGAYNPPDYKIDDQSYFDLAVQWAINKNWTVRAGVNNITDEDPPVVNSNIAGPSINGNGNTFPGVYDALGRNIFLSVTAKF